MWGGKRKGSGRSKVKEKDWMKYKEATKERKNKEASKSSGDIRKVLFGQIGKKGKDKTDKPPVVDVNGAEGSKKIDEGSKKIDEGSKNIDDGSKEVDEGSKMTDEGKNDETGDFEDETSGEIIPNLVSLKRKASEEINIFKQSDGSNEKVSCQENLALANRESVEPLRLVYELPSPLPFFVNGCYDQGVQQGPNYTCAPDTLYSIIEAVLLTPGGEAWQLSEDLILGPAMMIIQWRLRNKFSWNRDLRVEFWNSLCLLFPGDMLPKGTVTAAIDSSVDYLSTKCPVQVVFSGDCHQCASNMGWFKYTYEGPLIITTSNMKVAPLSLADVCLTMVSKRVKQLIGPGAQRVQCQQCGAWGGAAPKISISNLSMPSVLVLGFLVKARGSQDVKCSVEEAMTLGSNYSLVAAAVVKPSHFVAVTKIQGKFYNQDNLDKSSGKKQYSSFKEAFIRKETGVKEVVSLDKQSPECRRAGAVHNLFYVGEKFTGDDYSDYESVAIDVNKLCRKCNQTH